MAPASSRNRNAQAAGTTTPNRQPPPPDASAASAAPAPEPDAPAEPRQRRDERRRHAVHQPKDKSAKAFYGDKQVVAEFLAGRILGKVVPAEIAARLDLDGLSKGQTEYVDLEFRKVRHADLVWRAPFRDTWLYVVFLFEAQSKPDWRMPARILLETALIYDDLLARNPEVRRRRKLPPVLPIVVYVGEEPWPGATRMEDLLADDARAILPFALGQEFVLVSEAAEARALGAADTSWAAGLRLRYTRDRAEFVEAYARLRELLPEDGPASRALAAWVRSGLIDDGAKEEEVKRLQRLGDLERVAHTFWGAERLAERRKGRAEGRAVGRAQGRKEGRREAAAARREQRATLVRLAGRKFGSETAEGLASLLERVSDAERVAEIADLIIDCTNGSDFLARAAAQGGGGE